MTMENPPTGIVLPEHKKAIFDASLKPRLHR
jgi:hypothetical protein